MLGSPGILGRPVRPPFSEQLPPPRPREGPGPPAARQGCPPPC